MNLIKIELNDNNEQVVSARDLHEKLESKERFSKWFLRMCEYGFENDIDFTSVKKSTVVNNG
ncbi:MAG: antA/AntB antirepressor family protein, partial [Cetobacterium sp.]